MQKMQMRSFSVVLICGWVFLGFITNIGISHADNFQASRYSENKPTYTSKKTVTRSYKEGNKNVIKTKKTSHSSYTTQGTKKSKLVYTKRRKKVTKYYPNFYGDIDSRLLAQQTKFGYNSNSTIDTFQRSGTRLEINPYIDAMLGVEFMKYLRLESDIVIEPINLDDKWKNNGGSESQIFDSLGIYIETLQLKATLPHLDIYGGKFNLNFGKAKDDNRRMLWLHDNVEGEYDLNERVGAGAKVYIGGDKASFGKHGVGVEIFTRYMRNGIHNILGGARVTRRNYDNYVKNNTGLPGDNDKPESGAFYVEGELTNSVMKFGYHGALIKQKINKIDAIRAGFYRLGDEQIAGQTISLNIPTYEQGIVGSVNFTFPNSSLIKFDILAEFAKFSDSVIQDYSIFADRSYFTTYLTTHFTDTFRINIGFMKGEYDFPNSYSIHKINQDIYETSFAIDYKLEKYGMLELLLGIKYEQETLKPTNQKVDTTTFGALLRYNYKFDNYAPFKDTILFNF